MRRTNHNSFRTRHLGLAFAVLSLMILLPAAFAIVVPHMIDSLTRVDRVRLQAAAQAYPNFTTEQGAAKMREAQAQLHPLWKNLSWSGRVARTAMFAKRFSQIRDASTAAASANFFGNLTVVSAAPGTSIALQRQPNCSLSLYAGTYTFSANPTIQVQSATPNYEQTLHSESGLATQPDIFTKGCAEATLGIGWRQAVYLGETAQNLYMGGAAGYDMLVGSNVLYYGTIDATTQTVHSFKTDSSQPGIQGVAAGDLNGDGLADIVGIDALGADISVWLANPDGTISTGTSYPLTGNITEAVVLADVNGDGKVDAVVATRASGGQEYISVLTGKGDGTLNAPQQFTVSAPSSFGTSQTINNLITADLRGIGHLDIVGSNGLVLLNNGDGTFTAGSAAFPPSIAASDLGPNLAAGDFNKDGKIDLAVGTGVAVHIYLGNGDGTFTAGKSYASISDVGYLTATDLDGDGNLDLYVGVANGGFFGADSSGATQAYALMGNGDGTFQGAPSLPFTYTGNNLADLNGDKIVDAVGVNKDLSLTSYLGDGKGGFSAKSTLTTTPVTLGGQQYTLGGIDTFAIGDINGDGVPDLVYIPMGFNGPTGTPGVFIALGDGQGGFAAPTFHAVPSTLATNAIDIDWSIANLHLADLNKDGKADLTYNYTDSSSLDNTTYYGTAVQLGNGDGTFQAPQTLATGSMPYNEFGVESLSAQVQLVTDLNKDGIPDLVFISSTSVIDTTLSTAVANIQVALGKGDGTFSTPATVAGPDIMVQSFTDVIPASIAVADMNGDGIPDIVALGSTSSTYDAEVAIALGNGDGTFKAPILTIYAGQYLNNDQGLAVADFNGDGKLDVAIVDPYIQTNSGISLGNGDGTLQTTGTAGAALPKLAFNLVTVAPVVALDLNGDGVGDLIAGNIELLSTTAPAGTPPTQADFSITAGASSATVTAGSSATATIALTPSGGFDQSVSLSCSGLPTGATCTFTPAAVTVNGSAATSSLTIATTGSTAMNFVPGGVVLLGICAPIAVRRRHKRRRKLMPSASSRAMHVRWSRWRAVACLLVVLLGALALYGCGGGGSGGSAGGGSGTGGTGTGGTGGTSTATPAGTYAITITGTAGSTTHSVSYSLVVN
jgi:FG-GAP-like repeat